MLCSASKAQQVTGRLLYQLCHWTLSCAAGGCALICPLPVQTTTQMGIFFSPVKIVTISLFFPSYFSNQMWSSQAAASTSSNNNPGKLSVRLWHKHSVPHFGCFYHLTSEYSCHGGTYLTLLMWQWTLILSIAVNTQNWQHRFAVPLPLLLHHPPVSLG